MPAQSPSAEVDPQLRIAITTHSEPADLSDVHARPSLLLDPIPDNSPTLPSTDIESGNRENPKKRHWWSWKEKEPRQHSPVTAQAYEKTQFHLFKEILFSSWANVLLVFIPVGIALHFVNVNPTVIFVMNFLAIVPLAGVSLLSLWGKPSPHFLPQFGLIV